MKIKMAENCSAEDLIVLAKAFLKEQNEFDREKEANGNSTQFCSVASDFKFPPIWNEEKLTKYTERLVDEYFVITSQRLTTIKSKNKMLDVSSTNFIAIVENDSHQNKNSETSRKIHDNHKFRSIGTNINFVAKPTKDHSPGMAKPKKPVKFKTSVADEEFEKKFFFAKTSEFVFPKRLYRHLESLPSDSITKYIGSPTSNTDNVTVENKSTSSHTCIISSDTKSSEHGNENSAESRKLDDVVGVNSDAVESFHLQKMTLPSVILKGSCKVQKIYKIDISPKQTHQNVNTLYCEVVAKDLNCQTTACESAQDKQTSSTSNNIQHNKLIMVEKSNAPNPRTTRKSTRLEKAQIINDSDDLYAINSKISELLLVLDSIENTLV